MKKKKLKVERIDEKSTGAFSAILLPHESVPLRKSWNMKLIAEKLKKRQKSVFFPLVSSRETVPFLGEGGRGGGGSRTTANRRRVKGATQRSFRRPRFGGNGYSSHLSIQWQFCRTLLNRFFFGFFEWTGTLFNTGSSAGSHMFLCRRML
jgi:hypothetical protein